MTEIRAKENKIVLADGSTMDYDVVCVNVGSKTRHTETIPGVWEHSLTTRPINDLLPKITKKEKDLKDSNTIPVVGVIGHGAAGVELAFAFKARWSRNFG